MWQPTAVCLIAVSFFIGGTAWSRPVDLSAPSGEVGAANAKGYLEIWREIDDAGIDFGKGSYLPLRYKFSTDGNASGILGPGFYMPMFEARNTLIREDTMRAYLPCGKGLYFWKDRVDPNKFQTVDNEWSGYVTGDDFNIWRDDGWKILYHQGRLTSITTDENHVFIWNYDGNTHMATGINEDGKTLVTVEPNQQGLVDAIVFDGKRYELGYAERPLIEMVLGQPAVKQLAIAISSFKYPDGKMETFKFVLTPERVPTVTFTDPSQNSIDYTWDASTNHIVSEKGPQGDWTYKIGEITQDFGSPPIIRTRPDGRVEGMTVDNKMGTYTSLVDGVTTITHVFETSGPFYHKIQKIEEISGNVRDLVYQASYDETGHLIRSVNKRGYITLFKYDDTGILKSETTTLPTDPKLLNNLQEKGQQLTTLIAKATNETDRQNALRDLAQYYMFDMLDPAKAANLLSQLDHDHSFVIKLQELDVNSSLTAADKLKSYQLLLNDYPEKKEKLEFLINHYERKIE